MESHLARYLDGDLNEREAAALLDAAASDPQLERVLRSYEAMLREARVLSRPELDGGFTDDVMARVHAEPAVAPRVSSVAVRPRRNPRPRRVRMAERWTRVALAAVLAVVVFGAGFLSGRDGAGGPTRGAGDDRGSFNGFEPVATTAGFSPVAPGGATAGARWVRFVYQPVASQPARIAVAGSFNGWDASTNLLQRSGQIWSTVLLLPPGEHEYMFVEDGERWVTDPLAPRTQDDGFGGRNAVVEIRA